MRGWIIHSKTFFQKLLKTFFFKVIFLKIVTIEETFKSMLLKSLQKKGQICKKTNKTKTLSHQPQMNIISVCLTA